MDEFRVRTATPAAEEERDAREFWATKARQGRIYPSRPPFYALEVCRLIARLQPGSVLEFGCNAGRNLELLGRVCDELAVPRPRAVGVDINEESIAFGREQWDLELRVGDHRLLSEWRDGEVDVAFTISVIDHVPDAVPVLGELARVAGRWLLLVEPHHSERGRVEGYRSSVPDQGAEVTPYSYVHDYDALIGALGWVEVLNIPCPTGVARLGPLYRLRLLASSAEVAASRPPEASADYFLRTAILGLAEERQARFEQGKALRERIRKLEQAGG